MKKKTFACVLMLLVTIFVCLNSFGDDKEKYGFYVPRDNEEIYGTWVNITYPGSIEYKQKIVMDFWAIGKHMQKQRTKLSIMEPSF